MEESNQIPSIGDTTSILESLHNDDLIYQNKDDFSHLEDMDSDSECEISITIGEVDRNPFPNKQLTIPNRMSDGPETKSSGVDLYSEPVCKNMLIYDLDPVSIDDRPWNKPGADITDYFNYGFVEETWNIYRDRQRRIRQESTKLQRDVSIIGGNHGQVMGDNSMAGIMVLNSDPGLLNNHLHPDSVSSTSLLMPLMNPPTASGSMDLSRVHQNPQIPSFFPGHGIPPNYFMAQRFGMRGIPPQFQRPMLPNERNFRFPVKQEAIIPNDEKRSKNESPEKSGRGRERTKDRGGRSSWRRSPSNSSEKNRRKRRRRSRSDSRDKAKQRTRTRNNERR